MVCGRPIAARPSGSAGLAEVPPFPGAIGMSHLRVYDTEAPDGLAGGTPHLHTLCTEAYAVIAGAGRVQTLTASGFREVPLEPGALVWFTPGTIHRLVNEGGLEILVLMQNAGLPEAGDMVITFAPDVVADPARYAAAAILPAGEQTTTGSGAPARARRDAAVAAFVDLRASTEGDGGAALARFHASAAALVRPAPRPLRGGVAAGSAGRHPRDRGAAGGAGSGRRPSPGRCVGAPARPAR